MGDLRDNSISGLPKRIPAAAYLRCSDDKQIETSIPAQRTAIKKYAKAKGYNIVFWYSDEGISGDETKKRDGFLQMREDASSGEFQAVLCWNQSRFGRFDSLEAGHWIYPFREAGVQLVTLDEGPIDWNDFTGRLMYTIKQEAKKQFLIDLATDVSRGQLEAASKGSWIGSPPYAYQIEGKKKQKRLVLNDLTKAKIVRRIFREYVKQGRSMTNIANRLNDEGVPSSGGRGKPWRFDTVKCILENPAYVGDVVLGKSSYGKYRTMDQAATSVATTGKRVRKPESEWMVFSDRHESLIDRATFAKAKANLAKGKHGRSPHTPETNPYLLSNKLVCGHCGSPLWGNDSRKGRVSYECSRRKYHGPEACEGTVVKESDVLRCISDDLFQRFVNLDGKKLAWKAHDKKLVPGDLPKAFAKVRKMIMPRKQPKRDRERIEKQVARLDSQLAKARDNLVLFDAENIPAAQEKIRQWDEQRAELKRDLRQTKPPTEQDINTEVMETLRALYWLAVFFDALAHPVDPDDPSTLPEEGGWMEIPRDDPAVRGWTNKIESVTIHSRHNGKEGCGRRYSFESGKLRLNRVGVVKGNSNPDPSG